MKTALKILLALTFPLWFLPFLAALVLACILVGFYGIAARIVNDVWSWAERRRT